MSHTQPRFRSPAARTEAIYAFVAVDQAVDTALTYCVPEHLSGSVVPGARVLVPLGRHNKLVSGTVLHLSALPDEKLRQSVRPDGPSTSLSGDSQQELLWSHSQQPPARLPNFKLIQSVLTDVHHVPTDLLALADWIGRYYCAPVGMVLSTIVPAAVKNNIRLPQQRFVLPGDWPQLESPAAQSPPAATPRIVRRDRELLDRLVPWLSSQARAEEQVLDYAKISSATLRRLVKRGFLRFEKRVILPESRTVSMPTGDESPGTILAPVEPELQLTPDQRNILTNMQPLLDQPQFAVKLIQGVTGSGKTEVYIRAAERVVAAGRRVIVLVPEISLTPQTVARFMRRFERVAIMHSGLSDSQRHQHWRAVAGGWAQVVVGARSAVFAPAENLGLIVVDEEHESSYKQDNTPRYNARDVAVRRGQMLNIPVILGSATPSLESWHNACSNRHYSLLRMTSRPFGLAMPRVIRIDMKKERQQRRGLHILSTVLEHSLHKTLSEKGQAILLLNRRGYAHYVACPRCDWVLLCDHCDATMVVHQIRESGDNLSSRPSVVRCHYCLTSRILPKLCPLCQAKVVELGQGTQRAEEELKKKFPTARLLRMDSDSMRHGTDYQRSLEQFGRGEVDVLLGTQMIGKGLDFPNVRLVGVLNADLAMTMPNFRAAEKTFQLICQVSGRSGRSGQQGTVVVQTYQPNEPAIVYASNHDYDGFIKDELPHRESMKYPPFGRIIRLVLSDKDHDLVQRQALLLTARIRAMTAKLDLTGLIRIEGPQPPPMHRMAEHFRREIVLFSESAAYLQQVLGRLRQDGLLRRCKTDLMIDVDPLQMQ